MSNTRIPLWRAGAWLVAALHAAPLAAAVDQRPKRLEVWDLQLRTPADRLADAFVDYSCGTNGGPPALRLADWREFRRCPAEPSGLREVFFRYDDELEYWAKANDFETEIAQFSGTRAYGFAVVLSGLFDADGLLSTIRIVSDPRADPDKREDSFGLRNFLLARFGRDGWACVDLPAEPGETAVSGRFIKQQCRKTTAGDVQLVLDTRHLRKPGQTEFDPESGRRTEGQFESVVRFEMIAPR